MSFSLKGKADSGPGIDPGFRRSRIEAQVGRAPLGVDKAAVRAVAGLEAGKVLLGIGPVGGREVELFGWRASKPTGPEDLRAIAPHIPSTGCVGPAGLVVSQDIWQKRPGGIHPGRLKKHLPRAIPQAKLMDFSRALHEAERAMEPKLWLERVGLYQGGW